MNEEEYKYDEERAIEFIRKTLPAQVNEKYDNDEILYVIDIIWDYYENNGYLSLSSEVTDEETVDEKKLTDYVKKEIASDKEILMDPADIDLIVRGELQYEESLEDFI